MKEKEKLEKAERLRKVLVRVGDDQWHAVRFVAAANDMQPSELVREALREYLAKHDFDPSRIRADSEKYAVARGEKRKAIDEENSENSDHAHSAKSRRPNPK
jgi:hypothetical protein